MKRKFLFSVFICGRILLPATFAADCNLNNVEDSADIEAGVAEDCNANGIPDACDVVPLVFGTVGEPVALGGQPQLVASADLDGDGRADLIAGTAADPSADPSAVEILFSRASGDFERLPLDAPGLAAAVAADLDGDAVAELITADGDTLQVYANDGTGDWVATLEIPAEWAEVVRAADVDLDGRVDLVTLHPSLGSVSWFPGLGDGPPGEGSFGDPQSVDVVEPLGNAIVDLFLEAADFDGDGDVDFAIAGGRERAISILETVRVDGQTDVTFRVSHSVSAGGFLADIAAGDVDSDGLADLVGAVRGSVKVWRSLIGAGFAEPTSFRFSVETVALADLHGDGDVDFLMAGSDAAGNVFRVLRGRGDGSFLAPEIVNTASSLFQVGDFDGDGDIDLAVAASGGVTFLFQGERGGLVFDGTRYVVEDFDHKPHALEIGNLNGDPFPDAVSANNDRQTFFVAFGRADGAVESPVLHGPLGFGNPTVIPIDLDGDGLDDLIFRTGANARLGAALGLFVVRNLGDGNFDAPVFYPNDRFTTTGQSGLFLENADLDSDGHRDILVPGEGAGLLFVHYGDGTFELKEPATEKVGQRPSSVEAGDLDADGDLDVVVANSVSRSVSILLQETPRSFAAAIDVPVDGAPRVARLGDFDRDGDQDIVVADDVGNSVIVLTNRGDGRVDAPARHFPIGRIPLSLNAADLDRDGFLDLVATDRSGGSSVSVLLGRGDGTFSRAQRFGPGNNTRGAVPTDLDADGDIDIVIGHRGQGQLAGPDIFVLRNNAAEPVPDEAFLSTVCTPLDFDRVSVADGSPSGSAFSERRAKFLLPARANPQLLTTIFQNVARFPHDVGFLREVFPDRFADLTESGFSDFALRRASRDYFAGSVLRLVLEDGGVIYGFDVRTDPGVPTELLSREETLGVFARLRDSFTLTPLVYFPITTQARAAARDWDGLDLPVMIAGETAPPVDPGGNPTFALEIPEDTVLCGVFAVAGADRGVREELELKTRARLRAGSVTLPTAEETFAGDLFEEVLFGPERLLAEPFEDGRFRVLRIPGDETTTYRFTYAQAFRLPDDRLLELEVVSPLVFRGRGDQAVEESRTVPPDWFVALKEREALQATLDGEPLVRYGSCTYGSLPLWTIDAELEDGTRLHLEERFEEAEVELDTAPASLVRADLIVAGEERVVNDYFALVYSALRHNRAADYWMVLDPPLAMEGTGTVHVVELRAPESHEGIVREASAAYRGADFEVLGTPAVTSFTRAPTAKARFLRGDAGGDGSLDVADAIGSLQFLFGGAADVGCRKAADANDDGRINIVDPIAVLSALFGRGEALPEPFPECGPDPTEDGLTCRNVTPCQ